MNNVRFREIHEIRIFCGAFNFICEGFQIFINTFL